MMKVPTLDTFQKGATTLTGRIAAPEYQNFTGRQMQETGRALQGAGDTMANIAIQMQQEANATAAKESDTQATQRFNDALYNPESGFMVRQGKDAVLGYQDAAATLGKIRSETLDGVKNPAVRKMLEPVLAARMQNALDAMGRHSGQESIKYESQTADSRAMVSLQDAAIDPTNEQRFQQAIGITRGETATLAKLHGWDDATARLQATKYQDTGYRLRYGAWALSDPVSAFAHFQQNNAAIGPLMRDTIGRELFQHAAPELAQWLNAAGATLPAPNAPADPSEPRGVRNNNPGNLVRGTQGWEGEIQGGDPRYAAFGSPEAGIRAMGKTLLNYQDKYGLNTIEAIVGRWAPASENDTASYVRNVAKALGTEPDTVIDVRNPDTLNALTRAIIQQENGKQPYSDSQIAAGLAAATGNTPLKPAAAGLSRDPSAPTGIALIDSLPSDWKLRVLQAARSQASQAMSEAREALRGRVQDASAEYMATGFAKEPPTADEFIRAYGQDEGVKRYRDFQGVAALGQNLQQVRTLPADALADLVKSAKPAPGDGFAARQHNYEMLLHAVDTVTKARREDPVAYSITNQDFGLSPIASFSRVQDFGPELAKRAANAPQVAAAYGTPFALLSKAETRALGATLKASPVEGQKALLASLSKNVGGLDNFKQLMQSVAPDSPTLAVAGVYQARGLRTTAERDVADLILRGQAILTPMDAREDGKGHMGGQALLKMPGEKDLLADWTDVTGGAFKGKEKSADLFMQTAKAIYAARSAEEGDYSGALNSKRWKAAIMLATGGIERHNGSDIVMPYGMAYDTFQNTLRAQANTLAPKALNATAREMMNLPLENIGDGRYLFRRAAGYLVDKNGRPVVADLSGGR